MAEHWTPGDLRTLAVHVMFEVGSRGLLNDTVIQNLAHGFFGDFYRPLAAADLAAVRDMIGRAIVVIDGDAYTEEE